MHRLNITEMVQNEAKIDSLLEFYNKRANKLKFFIDKYNQGQILMQNQIQKEILSETFIADFNLNQSEIRKLNNDQIQSLIDCINKEDEKWKNLMIESHEKIKKLLNDFKEKQLMAERPNASLQINSFLPPLSSTQINQIQPVKTIRKVTSNVINSMNIAELNVSNWEKSNKNQQVEKSNSFRSLNTNQLNMMLDYSETLTRNEETVESQSKIESFMNIHDADNVVVEIISPNLQSNKNQRTEICEKSNLSQSLNINDIQPMTTSEKADDFSFTPLIINSHEPDKKINDNQNQIESKYQEKLKKIKSLKQKSNTNFKCDFDGKLFANRTKLLMHMHNSHKQEWCKICKEYKGNLSSHMKLVHTSENDAVNCEICKKKLKNQYILKQHLKTHNKQHECQKCGKIFALVNALNMHMKLHKNPDAFQCKFCDKNFTQKSALNRHMKIHEENRQKPHKCNQCEYSTDHKSSLNSHIKRKH